MEKKNIGHWASLFGGRKSFQMEIEKASEINAKWTASEFNRGIVLEKIAGWLHPLWGSDHEWLYLRRPEGVWKTRIPDNYPSDKDIGLYQQKTSKSGKTIIVGGTYIPREFIGLNGWFQGCDTDHPIDSADMDDKYAPERRGLSVAADKAVAEIGAVLEDTPERLLVKARAHFDAPPTFSISGEWLIAKDSLSGYTTAYPLDREYYLDAISNGRLWIRYGDRWIESFDVKVDV